MIQILCCKIKSFQLTCAFFFCSSVHRYPITTSHSAARTLCSACCPQGRVVTAKQGEKERVPAQPWTALLRPSMKTWRRLLVKGKSFLCQHLGILSSKRKNILWSIIDLRIKSKLATLSLPRALGKNRGGRGCVVGQRKQGGLCAEAGRDHVTNSRVSVRRFLRIYLREEVSWKPLRSWVSASRLSGWHGGYIVLLSPPCTSCPPQAFSNNTHPPQPVTSLWFL